MTLWLNYIKNLFCETAFVSCTQPFQTRALGWSRITKMLFIVAKWDTLDFYNEENTFWRGTDMWGGH